MSFEGYYQFLCKSGHSYNIDVYEIDDKAPSCPICKAPANWRNLVDQTNGSFDNDGKTRIDGFVELNIKTAGKTRVCKTCGDKHVSELTTFEIPKDKGVLQK